MRTIIAMTVLIGWLPVLAAMGLAHVALEHGARAWSDGAFGVAFCTVYCLLFGAGLWCYLRFFHR